VGLLSRALLPPLTFEVVLTLREPGGNEVVSRVSLSEVPTREQWLRHAARMFDAVDGRKGTR